MSMNLAHQARRLKPVVCDKDLHEGDYRRIP